MTINDIDALLPQTQCGLCDYDGCRPYAKAMLEENAPIDRCHPGGAATLLKLADAFNQDPEPYLPTVKQREKPPLLAVINENECIGCTKCIQACPVDAILGANKHMHSVIEAECTGCELCVEPCPVDCITMIELADIAYSPELARQRYQARNTRLEKIKSISKQKHQIEKKETFDIKSKQAAIAAAVARSRAKKKNLQRA